MPLSGRLLLVALSKPLDAARRVDQFLFAREEGMALAADLDPQLLLGGAGGPGLAAGAVHQDFVKLGLDVGFHGTRHSTDPRPSAQPPRGKAPRPARSPGPNRWSR